MAIQLDRKVKCGAQFVALRMLDRCDGLKFGDIYVPQTTGTNMRLGFYRIEDVGSEAEAEYGIHVGDYVLADRLSSFGHTEPVALMKYNNVICLTDAERKTYKPLRNMLFVKPTNTEQLTDVGGVYVQNYDKKLNTGKVVACNFDADLNLPFGEGDEVLLVKGGDVISTGDADLHIYKHDMIVCKFIDGE